jgi:hypothetical protein
MDHSFWKGYAFAIIRFSLGKQFVAGANGAVPKGVAKGAGRCG